MRTHRYSISRQKACRSCSGAKAKCDRVPGGCSRCSQRGLACIYPLEARPRRPAVRAPVGNPGWEASTPSQSPLGVANAPTPGSITPRAFSPLPSLGPPLAPDAAAGDASCTARPDAGEPSPPPPDAPPDFDRLDLVCPIDVGAVGTRWLHPYVPLPGQVTKTYPPRVAALIASVLRAYAGAAVRGRGLPPFVHATPMAPGLPAAAPLATCLRLVRVCAPPWPGAGVDVAVVEVLDQAMVRIHQRAPACGGLERLAIFQAYLLYTMVLFFFFTPPDPTTAGPSLRLAMVNLQEIAGAACQDGLLCRVEQEERVRPRWEAWIATEAKRRALFTMYLFDNVLSDHEGLPTFLGTELRGLPAPAGKALWAARTRREWEACYNVFLAEWPEGGLLIDELWAMPANFDEAAVAKRRSRVDQWLEDVDEFGMMIYSVTSCTHGG